MNREEINLLKEMLINALASSIGEGKYVDEKAADKAKVLDKAITLLQRDNDEEEDKETFIYRTNNKRDFSLVINSSSMLLALYNILDWERKLYNYKDYGEGSVVYRGELMTVEEWDRRKNNKEIIFNYNTGNYEDSLGEVPIKEVHSVYTREQICSELDYILEDVKSFVYSIME